jgi:hypothetical protein
MEEFSPKFEFFYSTLFGTNPSCFKCKICQKDSKWNNLPAKRMEMVPEKKNLP